MAKRLTDEKINQIAQEYISNNFVKSKALIACGYSEKYARTFGLKLYDNIRIKQAIERLQAKIAEKCEITFEGQVNKLQEVAELAKGTSDWSSVIAAIREQDKLAGLIVEKRQTEDLSAVQELTDEERQVLKRAALMLNNLKSRAG